MLQQSTGLDLRFLSANIFFKKLTTLFFLPEFLPFAEIKNKTGLSDNWPKKCQ